MCFALDLRLTMYLIATSLPDLFSMPLKTRAKWPLPSWSSWVYCCIGRRVSSCNADGICPALLQEADATLFLLSPSLPPRPLPPCSHPFAPTPTFAENSFSPSRLGSSTLELRLGGRPLPSLPPAPELRPPPPSFPVATGFCGTVENSLCAVGRSARDTVRGPAGSRPSSDEHSAPIFTFWTGAGCSLVQGRSAMWRSPSYQHRLTGCMMQVSLSRCLV